MNKFLINHNNNQGFNNKLIHEKRKKTCKLYLKRLQKFLFF